MMTTSMMPREKAPMMTTTVMTPVVMTSTVMRTHHVMSLLYIVYGWLTWVHSSLRIRVSLGRVLLWDRIRLLLGRVTALGVLGRVTLRGWILLRVVGLLLGIGLGWWIALWGVLSRVASLWWWDLSVTRFLGV